MPASSDSSPDLTLPTRVSTDKPSRLFTFGHGTLPVERFSELLASRNVRRLVDVRSFPGSRRNPQFGRETMAAWLSDAGVTYEWEQRLGGRRHKVTEHSRNVAWRVEAFRSYADWMETDEFKAGLHTLTELPAAQDEGGETAYMCSETVWWRCHRRLLSDHLVLVEKIPVFHLMHDGRVTPHPPMAEARVEGGDVIYDGGEASLGL